MVRSETSSEGLVTISLDRPDKANALTPGMLEALIAAVEAATTAGARALVLTGTGKVFSAGADLAGALGLLKEGKVDAFESMVANFQRTSQAIKYSLVPVVAAVHNT